LVVFGVLFGLVDFATVAPTQLLASQYFKGRSVGLAFGYLMFGHQIGFAVGAYLPGVVFDRTGSSRATFSAAAVALVVALIALIAYGSVSGLVGILAGPKYAWYGPVVLALFPRFWGHSFFNPKDIPFAAMFTLGTFLGTYWVNACLKAEQNHVIPI
jgi:hypothetical protein